MNKIFNTILLLICLFITACGDDNGLQNTAPICFEQEEYTVRFGEGASIPFNGGSGVYELTASNPDVLGKFAIDIETNERLYIQPAKTGESYLTIKDVNAEATVTLYITVVDFYRSFKIDKIEGTNTNEFFEVGREIRFIRNEENTKPIEVIGYDNLTFQSMTVGEGLFNINRTETNIFTMEFSLHHKCDEEFALYEYTMGGDGEYMTMFDHIFNFGWENNIASLSSRSQPVKRISMILTDKLNGCKINCSLQP